MVTPTFELTDNGLFIDADTIPETNGIYDTDYFSSLIDTILIAHLMKNPNDSDYKFVRTLLEALTNHEDIHVYTK